MGRNLVVLAAAMFLCVLTLETDVGIPVDDTAAAQIYAASHCGQVRIKSENMCAAGCIESHKDKDQSGNKPYQKVKKVSNATCTSSCGSDTYYVGCEE